MPDPIERDIPRGQAYGQAGRQRAFLSQTRSEESSVELPPEEPDEPVEVEGFGDFSEVLFAPSERPGEDFSAPVGTPTTPEDLPDHYLRLALDRRVSGEVRALAAIASRLRLLQPEAAVPPERLGGRPLSL